MVAARQSSNPLITLAKRQRAEVLAEDERNLEAISRAYVAMYENLEGDVDALILAIEKLDNPTAAQIQRLPQYKRLVRHGEQELDRFTAYLEITIGTAASAAIGLGLLHSAQLVNAATGGGFTGLQPGVVKPLLSYLDPAGPLYARLKELTGATVDKVVQSIIDGVGKGYNPRKIAEAIQDAFGGGLTDALRNTRTVQLYSYRDSARANYMATDGIVTGWVWWAELDGDTCMACVSEHGTVHDLEETLDGHYNCRCAPLPLIPEFGNPAEQSGQEWFDSLSEAEQRAMMGNSKHEAYAAGRFEFSQLSKSVDNDVYGPMRTETPLKDLVSE